MVKGQRKSKHTTLEGSNVAVGKTALTTPYFFPLGNIYQYRFYGNMGKIESFHRGKLGTTNQNC